MRHTRTTTSVEGAGRLDWREGWGALSRLARVTAGRAADASHFPAQHAGYFNSYVVRRYLPRVVFYSVALVLSFAIGAWVAIYL
jgi:hypothetical protein